MTRVLLWGGVGLLAMFVASAVMGPRIVCAGHNHSIAQIVCGDYYRLVQLWMRQEECGPPRRIEEIEFPLLPGGDRFARLYADPWGCDYRIVHFDGGSFTICSNGPDRVARTDDDICYKPRDDR